MFDKNRFLGMTDAIVAVAATVMVLKLNIPTYASMEAFREQFPVLMTYLISFTQIFLDWHEHHDTFVRADKINHRIFFVNCVWLMAITLIPFVTGMVGQSMAHTGSLLIYTAVLCIEQLVLIAESRMVARLNHIRIQDDGIIRTTRIITLISYGVAALTAVLFSRAALLSILTGCVVNIILICLHDRTEKEEKEP